MKFQIFYPVKPAVVNQPFGVNGDYYQAHGINIAGHNGIDFEAKHGQPVYATHDGVCYPEIDSSGGNGVVIRTLQAYDYTNESGVTTQCYYKTIYWHLIQDDAVVKTGEQVKTGDLIGYADSTGFSTADHLHFGLKPQLWNEKDWTWDNPEQLNGYLGAIDPQPYFNGFFAEEIPIKQKLLAAYQQLVGLLQQLLNTKT